MGQGQANNPHNPHSPSDIPLQLGWISYWNLYPLRRELERLAEGEIEFHKGTPAVVNRWLADGKVALAPSSSVCLLKCAGNEIALPLGIASTGPVGSVYIGLHHEDIGLVEYIRGRQQVLREIIKQGQAKYPGDARKVASFLWKMVATLPQIELAVPPPLSVTAASATSANLARVLYRLWFGDAAFELRAAETASSVATCKLSMRRPMELLIGDEALQRKGSFRAVIDLGEAWRELTDLPFVFAVWQTARASRGISPYWRQKIQEAAEIAQARMRVEPTYYLPETNAADVLGHTIDLSAYWKGIQYRLGAAHFRGLALYLSLVRCMRPEAFEDQAVVNIMRWESLGQSSFGPSV